MKQRKRPNAYSLHRIERINAEVPERIKLIARCGGIPRFETKYYKRNDGTVHEIRRVQCIGGTCEECGKAGRQLFPHEKHARGHWENGKFGSVSLENSVMVCNECHDKLQNRSPRLDWLK